MWPMSSEDLNILVWTHKGNNVSSCFKRQYNIDRVAIPMEHMEEGMLNVQSGMVDHP